MTRDDIICMAREAWLTDYGAEQLRCGIDVEVDTEELEAFAALVAAAEREACAKVCEEPGWNAANWCAKQIRARGDSNAP